MFEKLIRHNFVSLDGQVDCVGGNTTGGCVGVHSFTADFLASIVSISHNPILNEFSITGTLGNIEFFHSTFAGSDVASLFGASGIAGSFFGFNYIGRQ